MTLKASGVGVGRAAFTPDGRVLAAVSDRNVIFWDMGSNTEIALIMEFKGNVYGIAFSPDGTQVGANCHGRPYRAPCRAFPLPPESCK